MNKLILASNSPRRRELALLLPYEFIFRSTECPEDFTPALTPEENIKNIAKAKAESVRISPEETVIGCDTIVLAGGEIFGKPENDSRAAEMLRRLSGREHAVITGVCILFPDLPPRIFTETTRVFFDNLTEKQIADYIRSGEPADKAGAYGIQGGGALFVRKIEGDYYNVVGLPVHRIYKYLSERQFEKR